MDLFVTVKSAVTVRETARHYGSKAERKAELLGKGNTTEEVDAIADALISILR